jgi:hypothetical protein
LLTNAPILWVAYPSEGFVVCTNACKEGMWGFLNQNGFMICYESRKLKENAKNYATHDLELVAIAHAMKKWRHYFMGRRFELRPDLNHMTSNLLEC